MGHSVNLGGDEIDVAPATFSHYNWDRNRIIDMNVAVTCAIEDLPPRRAFTVEDLHRMIEIGVLAENERIELIGGELFVMAAKGYAHEVIKSRLARSMVQAAPDDVEISVEISIQFAEDILLEPDIAVFPRGYWKKSNAGFVTLDRGALSLAVEVAASSLRYDMKLKSRLYAGLGVQEFWVVDANERVAWIHTGPTDDGWSSIVERGPSETLTTPALPDFAIKLGEID
jgi:Uma2 family endonuclease